MGIYLTQALTSYNNDLNCTGPIGIHELLDHVSQAIRQRQDFTGAEREWGVDSYGDPYVVPHSTWTPPVRSIITLSAVVRALQPLFYLPLRSRSYPYSPRLNTSKLLLGTAQAFPQHDRSCRCLPTLMHGMLLAHPKP